MHKKILFPALLLSFSQGAFAFDKATTVDAITPVEPIEPIEPISYVLDESAHNFEDQLSEKPEKSLSKSYFTLSYLGMNGDAEATGFEISGGTKVLFADVSVGYRISNDIKITAGLVPLIDNLEQVSISVMFPVVETEGYKVTFGGSYVKSSFDILETDTETFFGTIKATGYISDSIIGFAKIDVALSDESILVGADEYRAHDDFSYSFGIDYQIDSGLAVGTSVAIGSELDTIYKLNFSYNF